MAVSNQTSQVDYDGNGSNSTPYPIPFRYDEVSWITVEVEDEDGVGSTLSIGADYTITDGATEEGEIVTTEAIPDTSVVRISRNTPLTHTLSLPSNGAIPSRTIVTTFDKIVMGMIDQERRMTANVGNTRFTIGTVTHLAAGETPTANVTGTWPSFEIDLGLPTGATGQLNIGPDASFGTTPNNLGGPALTIWDKGLNQMSAVWLNFGALEAGSYTP